MSKNEGGSAFPARWLQFYDRPGSPPGNTIIESPGMSLRTYIATAALEGVLASHANPSSLQYPDAHVAAREAVQYADALIAELGKPTDD